MEGSALGVPDLSGARETTGIRNSLSASAAEPPRDSGSGNLQPSARVAGFDGPARGGASTPSSPADDHAERQRSGTARADSASSVQDNEKQCRSRQDRLPARTVLCALRARKDLSQTDRTGGCRTGHTTGARRCGSGPARVVCAAGANDRSATGLPQPPGDPQDKFHRAGPSGEGNGGGGALA